MSKRAITIFCIIQTRFARQVYSAKIAKANLTECSMATSKIRNS